ncbi:uncharacterized protein BO72DRAFT_458282 [Aspergillus fijiensis CBS 313.89]|uniref:Uncharacterized protein n=1 Tax=Aspergillus fijiensis CBS 313.89 TaxID=1448319 RepID=A0A8G1VZB4_9EURO|nr:uncharacterized protein BO72DRAFT_458282 [Aspergillus fijiensis CBS 313.89]RAK78107.1 hypothetical protein BO72DRAFT_458282 [Aspergillus fijiensis CBS 313.89]
MKLSIGSILAVALTVANSVTAAPTAVEERALQERASNIIIGYRTVSKDQAAKYNKAGTLTYEGNRANIQLGEGTYLTANRGGWAGSATDWYCVIYADKTKFAAATKAWIPKTYGTDGEIWYKKDKIDAYIKAEKSTWTPAETVRVSKIDGDDHTYQLVVPPKLSGSKSLLGKWSKGPLDISVTCAEREESLPDSTVNYATFNNIVGTAQ